MSERSELGRIPIPGDNPVGEPLSGDDDFDALRQEVSRDPVLGVPVDWKLVAELGQKLLGERSKDFTVAGYLAVALTETNGLAGLHDGLKILWDLIDTYWDTAYPPFPKRTRGRVNAFTFVSEKGAPMLADIEPKAEDAEAVAECTRLLEEIWKIAGDKCEGHEVSLGDLTRSLRDLSGRVPKAPEPAAPAAEAAPGGAAPEGAAPQAAAPAAAASAAPAATAVGDITSRGDAMSTLLKISSFLKGKDAKDALAYRLPRIAAFADIVTEPPDDNGKLMIPGPEASRLNAMRSMWSSSDWMGLIDMAENVCRESPLCLDAHRFAAEGLSGLGGPHQAAADGIRDEVRAMLKRAPRLLRLQFQDGTPLADGETQQWLQEEAGGAPAAAAAASEVDPEELEKARAEARELTRKGDLPGALARLDAVLAGDSSPRGRFLGRLELAELCASSNHDRVAVPMLGELDDTLQRHGLESWEPALSRRVLELYYQCRKRLVPDGPEAEEAQARAEKLYERLCRVDPVAAAALE